jgi:STE24 endopeptidase
MTTIVPGTPFDAKAATDAFLAVLPPAAHLKAIHYTQGGHWLLLWGWLVTVVACLVIARSRVLNRTEAALTRKRPRPILVSLVLAAIFFVADDVLELPWNVYANWWREKGYGLTSQSFGGWLSEQLIGDVIGVVLTGVFLVALYALIRRAPRVWWAWAGGLVAIFTVFILVISPVLIEPIFNKFTPAPPGVTRDAVVALAKTAGVPSDKIYIYNGSKQSNRYTANVSGLFGSARVAMSDVMFKKNADIPEVRGVVGHEMGHYKRNHVIFGAIASAVLSLVGLGLINLAFPTANRWLGAGAAGVADPAGLPVLIALVVTLSLLATPLTSTLSRLQEADADAFSLRVAHEPDGLSKALVKTIEYRADSPSWLVEVIFYDHPSVRRRVQTAMNWKARHMELAKAQAEADAALEHGNSFTHGSATAH